MEPFYSVLTEYFIGLCLIVLLFSGHSLSHFLSGLILSLLTTVPLRFIVGRSAVLQKLYAFFFFRPLMLIVPLRFAGWALSSSGMFLGYLGFSLLWGEPKEEYELWIILSVAIICAFNVMMQVMFIAMLDFTTVVSYTTRITPWVHPNSALSDSRHAALLVRVTYVDHYIPQFGRFLVCIGFIFYAIGQLSLVQLIDNAPTLSEALALSFSLIPIGISSPSYYEGIVWSVILVVSSLMILYWSVIFVGFAMSAASDEITNWLQTLPKDNNSKPTDNDCMAPNDSIEPHIGKDIK